MARANKTADKRTRSQSRFSDPMPNPGPGLFTVQADYDAQARAITAIKAFLKQHTLKLDGATWEKMEAVLSASILDTVRHYRADCVYDDRVSGRELKVEARKLLTAAKRFESALSTSTIQLKIALNRQCLPRSEQDVYTKSVVDQCVTSTSLIVSLCEVVSSRPVQAVLHRSVKNACARLWKMWEQATGRLFNRSLRVEKGKQDSAHNVLTWEMHSIDALFVQVVIQAIDPDVHISEIHTGLQYVKAESPR